MDTLKKVISVILAAIMLFMLLPVIENESKSKADTAADREQRLDTCYSLALDAIDAEDYETAKTYINTCFSLCDPETNSVMYADLLLKQACIAVMEEQNAPALLALERALEVQPDLADAYLVRTQIYTSQGETDKAVCDLEKYIELTGDAALYETLSQLYETRGDLDAAQAAYEKFVAGTGGDMDKAGVRAGIYKMRSGQLEEAASLFESYLDSSTCGAEAAYYAGICRMSLEDYAVAKEDFDVCVEKGGSFEGLYYNRGVCSLVGTEWEDASADFIKSIETEPYVEDSRYNLGICQMQMEDYESAAASFTELIGDGDRPGTADQTAEAEEKDGVDLEAYYCRAMCNAMLGNLEAAINDYTVCIDRGYELAQCYAQRAQVYSALGDAEHCKNDLQLAQQHKENGS